MPFVGWAERGDGRADGHGNSVPRFHLTWGTGPEVVRVFLEPVLRPRRQGPGRLPAPPPGRRDPRRGRRGRRRTRHRAGARPTPSRGVESSREKAGEFELRAPAVVVTSGGIGHNHELIRKNWPVDRLGPAPEAHDPRRPGARRRPDAGDHRERRRQHRQPRPDVALHRGHPQLGPDLARPRDPDHPRARRRSGSTRPASGCRRRSSPGFDSLGTLRAHRSTGLRLHVVHPQPVDHREGVRALRLGAEPRHHRQGPEGHRQVAARQGRSEPGAEVRRARRGLRDRRQPRRPRRRDERASRAARSSTSPTSSSRSSRATGSSTTRSPRTSS